MRKPVSRILVINDEQLVLKEFVKLLNAAAKSLDNPLGITFTGIATARDALKAIEEDGDIQAVIVDDTLYTLKNDGGSSRVLQMSALELVQKITRFRPELDVYILIAQEQEDEVVDALFSEAVDGYFYREERDYRGIYRILNAQMQEKADTPFYDQLKTYVLMAKDAWHTPGHSSGDSLRDSPWVSDFYEFMGEHVFDADLSVSGADAGFPDGAERRDPGGAEAGGQGLRRAPDVLRHQRHLYRQQGYLPDADRPRRETAARPQLPQVGASRRGVVRRASDLSRLFGQQEVRHLRSDPEEDNPARHRGARRRRGRWCSLPAPMMGCAMTWRPLSRRRTPRESRWSWTRRGMASRAFTRLSARPHWSPAPTTPPRARTRCSRPFPRPAWSHVNDPDFNEHIFRENFNMHTSTSPQYSMIASLDVARKQAIMEGYKLLSRTLSLSTELRHQINSTGVFRVLELDDLLPDEVRHDNIQLDPTKVTVDISECGYTVDELQHELFERYNIQVEKSTFNTLSLLLTIGTTRSKVSRLYDALMRIARERRSTRRIYRTPDIPGFTHLKYLPRDAFYCGGQGLPILDDQDRINAALNGKVAADQITPYPPGIPVLVPGQVITAEIMHYLAGLLRSHKRVELHGIVYDGYMPCVRVLTPNDEKGLKKLKV
jgi:arginine decarboxylase